MAGPGARRPTRRARHRASEGRPERRRHSARRCGKVGSPRAGWADHITAPEIQTFAPESGAKMVRKASGFDPLVAVHLGRKRWQVMPKLQPLPKGRCEVSVRW